jgi:putative Mg2+ transporter-C (MgtC) family protein
MSISEEIWTTIAGQFSDITDVRTLTLTTMRLFLAALLGGILGFERESKARSAGVRTHMLVAVGAALFVIGPVQSGMEIADLSRVLQGIVQGIGFLGAGAIIVRNSARTQVEGLTTAAGIWGVAGIGVLVGLGLEATAILSTIIILLILAFVPLVFTSAMKSGRDRSDPPDR